MSIEIKRVYETPTPADGTRILVDRLWPRGLTKEQAQIDIWLKDIAPSSELRVWFGHDPARWDEFQVRYTAELDANAEAVKALREQIESGLTTLIYAAKDPGLNHALALKRYLEA
jgi:uncharacterized protein YeaO (DUF488 family)